MGERGLSEEARVREQVLPLGFEAVPGGRSVRRPRGLRCGGPPNRDWSAPREPLRDSWGTKGVAVPAGNYSPAARDPGRFRRGCKMFLKK